MKEFNDKLEHIKDLFDANSFDMVIVELEKLKKFIKQIKINVRRYNK